MVDFQPGEQIVHRYFGVGKILSIERMTFTGSEPGLFYHVEFPKTTVWVPVGDRPPGRLRPITPKNQLFHFRALLKSSPAELSKDFQTRNIRLKNLMDYGAFQGLCEVVRDLSTWNRLNPMKERERALWKQARATLAAEWSATSGISVGEALEEVDGYLLTGSPRAAAD